MLISKSVCHCTLQYACSDPLGWTWKLKGADVLSAKHITSLQKLGTGRFSGFSGFGTFVNPVHIWFFLLRLAISLLTGLLPFTNITWISAPCSPFSLAVILRTSAAEKSEGTDSDFGRPCYKHMCIMTNHRLTFREVRVFL